MTERMVLINAALRGFEESRSAIVKTMRHSYLNVALAERGEQPLSAEELAEVTAAVEAGELPYAERAGCERCAD